MQYYERMTHKHRHGLMKVMSAIVVKNSCIGITEKNKQS